MNVYESEKPYNLCHLCDAPHSTAQDITKPTAKLRVRVCVCSVFLREVKKIVHSLNQ